MKTITGKQDVYDQLAGIYPAKFDKLSPKQIAVRTAFAGTLKRKNPKPALLDVGCGTGRDMKFFADLGCDVTGIDISPNMLAVAREKGLGNLVQGDFTRHPFADASFDGIWCLSMLQDLPDEKVVAAAVAKLASILKPGGTLFVVHPRFPSHPSERVIVERKEYGFTESHINLSLEQLRALFARSSFKTLSEQSSLSQNAESGETKEYIEFVVEKRT